MSEIWNTTSVSLKDMEQIYQIHKVFCFFSMLGTSNFKLTEVIEFNRSGCFKFQFVAWRGRLISMLFECKVYEMRLKWWNETEKSDIGWKRRSVYICTGAERYNEHSSVDSGSEGTCDVMVTLRHPVTWILSPSKKFKFDEHCTFYNENLAFVNHLRLT